MDKVHSLAQFVTDLEDAGGLERVHDPVSLRSVGRLSEESDRALLFERVVGSDLPLLINAMATRQCWAVALGVPESDIRAELTRRSARLGLGTERVPTGPVKERVLVGDEVDVTRLPVHVHHELDGGPYITASMDVSARPGGHNLGMRRLMLRGRRETGVDAVAPTDLRSNYRVARERGEPFPIAFVVGCHPLDVLASQLPIPVEDEYEVMSALRGAPVPVVACETVPIEVPADAEMVLEGYLEGDWSEVEGPFGEYTGCYGMPHLNPTFHVTAMTSRSDPIFSTVTIGGTRLAHTDTALLSALTTEFTLWEAVRRAVAEPRAVYCPPAATGLHHARVAIKVRDRGDARNAVLAALGSRANIKHVVVVDEDIDIASDEMVEWAVATRFQADRDAVVVDGMRTLPLDPSLPPREGVAVTGGKLGLDATCRTDRPRHIFDIPRAPLEAEAAEIDAGSDGVADPGQIEAAVLGAVSGGATFADLLVTAPTALPGEVVRALEQLRARGAVELRSDGRWWGTADGS